MDNREKQNETVSVDLNQLLEFLEKNRGAQTQSQPSYATKKTNNEIEINVIDILSALVHRWWMILFCAFICAAGAFAYFFLTNTTWYTSTAQVYVNNKDLSIGGITASISTGDLSASENLVPTYTAILKTRETLSLMKNALERDGYYFVRANGALRIVDDDIAESLRKDGRTVTLPDEDDANYEYQVYNAMLSMISTSTVESTAIFNVTVSDPSGDIAVKVANVAVDVLKEQINDIIEGASTKIVDPAFFAVSHQNGFATQTLIGGLVGVVIACAYIVLKYCIFNDVVDSSDWIVTNFDRVPILAEIPDIFDASTSNKNSKYYRYRYYKQTPEKDKTKTEEPKTEEPAKNGEGSDGQ